MVIVQSSFHTSWASPFEMELEPNSLDWNQIELECELELEGMKHTKGSCQKKWNCTLPGILLLSPVLIHIYSRCKRSWSLIALRGMPLEIPLKYTFHTCKNLIPMVVTRAMANSSKSHALLMCRIWKMGWKIFSSLDFRENTLFVLFPA